MAFSEEDNAIISQLVRALGRGEVSTLAASLNLAGSQIGTSTDSANYAFLRALTELGHAKEQPFEDELLAEAQVTSFTINEDVKRELGQLLKSVSSFTDE